MRAALRATVLAPRDLFRDDFMGDLSRWVKTDTENKISLAGGNLLFAGGKAAPAWGDPVMAVNQIIQRQAGVCLEVDVADIAATNTDFWVGFCTDTAPGDITGSDTQPAISFRATAVITPAVGASAVDVAAYAAATPYRLRVILGSYDVANKVVSPNGFMVFIQGGAFGTLGSGSWVLLWRDTGGSTASLYHAISNNTADIDFGYARVYRHPFPMPVVYDSFNRADGVMGNADSGRAWISQEASPGIASNKAKATTNAVTECVAESRTANGLIQETVNVGTPGGTGLGAGPLVRDVDTDNFLWAYIYVNGVGGGSFNLAKIIAGVSTGLGAWGMPAENTDYAMAVLANDTSLRVYVDGVQRISATDAAHQTATKHGWRTSSAGGSGDKTQPTHDNFLVQGGLA